MPVYDYQCRECEVIDERFASPDEKVVKCKVCGALANRVYMKMVTIRNDSEWLRDTLQVVDKDGGVHCQKFLKNPNKKNYKNWMKGEGLRPLEPGESMKVGLPKEEKTKLRAELRHKVQTSFRNKEAITVS